MSKDKKKVLDMSSKGQIIQTPADLIKDPIILEFLDLKEGIILSESSLEKAIINKLQDFIMELGKGFSFIGRQYRIRHNDIDYYIDLVFYNKYLMCSVILELKLGKLKPQDLGQLQFYVGYFNKFEKASHENDAIGILVCEEKDDTIVKITLPEDNKNIFAVEYKKYLPSAKELKNKVLEEIKKHK
jgi:predicted nuclease of restriction endonuclease-like (RecB) superfamily